MGAESSVGRMTNFGDVTRSMQKQSYSRAESSASSKTTAVQLGGSMIDAETRNAIWRLYKQGKTKREIARLFDLDKKTVFQIIKNEGRPPSARRRDRIEPDLTLIQQVHKRCRGFVRRTHEVLTEEYGVEMGYSTLTRLLGEIKKEKERAQDKPPPREAEPGLAMQHDTSPHVIELGGQKKILQCAGLYFRYSKVRYIKYYTSFDKFAMKGFMHEALTYWKYAAGTCMIDNTSLAVHRGTGPDAVFHDDMNTFAKRYGFEWTAHPIMKPNWKAGKERNFRTVETNFIPGRTFKNLEDLNRQALKWATSWYFQHPDEKTKLVPTAQWEIEKPYLQELSPAIEPPYRRYSRDADKNGFIPVSANYYWVPKARQEQLEVVEYPGQIKVYRGQSLLVEYLLKPGHIKHERVIPEKPEGYAGEKKARDPHPKSDAEENKLKCGGEIMARYLDFIGTKQGAVRYRHKFIKGLYSLSLRTAPSVFQKVIARALDYKINSLDSLERMIIQLVRSDSPDWPETFSSSDDFESRESYLEGKVSAQPDLFAYAKLLKSTKNPPDDESNGGSENGSGK